MTHNVMRTAPAAHEPKGRFIDRDGETLYEITRLDAMPPFLMTLVGDTDLWMYISSAGALTAGRVEPDRCIFPYETDDRLHELGGLSGPITLIRFADGRLWRPFDSRPGPSSPSRVLRRSPTGDRVEFEEADSNTGLRVRVAYALVNAIGLVRRVLLGLPTDAEGVRFELLDGYRNVMPANVPLILQQQMSTLVDGYKRAELVAEHGPAIYALESAISDSPQANESLRATTIWHSGLPSARIVLDDAQVAAFERGDAPAAERLATGRRGAYLCHTTLELAPDSERSWMLVADAHQDHASIESLRSALERDADGPADAIDAALRDERARLNELLLNADSGQVTADRAATAMHQSNVLYNSMRGGVPVAGYRVEREDFSRFVGLRSRAVRDRHAAFLDGLNPDLSLETLAETAAEAGDPQLERIALEYLPLTFGRRHGDPSRPWNRFRIRIRDEAGDRVTSYEGNWRDIFQNWEATSRSYPAMLPGVISKFFNATTAEGYNPYRINERGIDWEIVEPDNPRSNIGYWGDHQIIYLHRLLEQCEATYPAWLASMLDTPLFAYAEVPYRFKPFEAIMEDPRNSLEFDETMDAELRGRTSRLGADGGLLLDSSGQPRLVTMLEKLLVPAMAKAANLVPGGGIWMNTQRPEWNDANNALAGNGLSMVTLYQLRRYADWCLKLLDQHCSDSVELSGTIAAWCDDITAALAAALEIAGSKKSLDDAERYTILTSLGRTADRARASLRDHGLGAPTRRDRQVVADFFRMTRDLCDRTIATAKRPDGLFESYRVLQIDGEEAAIKPLHAMLEGQVAVLAAGVLPERESIGLLETLFASDLYREDQKTFVLYPRVDLPDFLERNAVPPEAVEASPLLSAAIDHPGWLLASRDVSGAVRFFSDLTTVDAIRSRVAELASDPRATELVEADGGRVFDAYEATFGHTRFTGRSGTMHKFEGLGSVYWHMVSKLLLAVQDTVYLAVDRGASAESIAELRSYYRRVREGLGFRKSPAEFGAIPYEAYSHTPWRMGAQQPGMTGQVKEGVLARFGEVGVRLTRGHLRFDATLIDEQELLSEPSELPIGPTPVPAGSMASSVAGVPVVISRADTDGIQVHHSDGRTTRIDGTELSEPISQAIFARDGSVAKLVVGLRW